MRVWRLGAGLGAVRGHVSKIPLVLRRGPLAHRQLVSLGALKKARPRAGAAPGAGAKGRSVSGGRRREAILLREEFGPPFMRNSSWPYSWGAEGENRRLQPLPADRVGLKPPITEGYERAMGLVAAFLSARDEKDFRRMAVAHWPRRPPPSVRSASLP